MLLPTINKTRGLLLLSFIGDVNPPLVICENMNAACEVLESLEHEQEN